MLTDEQVALRVAREIEPGMRVYIGAGVAAEHRSSLPAGTQVVTEGGDLALVGAEQISMTGQLAGGPPQATTAGRIIAVVSHCTETGEPRIREACSLPVSLPGAVQRIITDMAVIDVQPEGLVLREVAPGNSARDVQDKTDAPLLAASDMRLLKV